MKRELRLSVRASRKLEILLLFLEREWSEKVKNEFIIRLDKSLKQIQKLPESCPESQIIKGLRKCVVTKQTTVFYKVSETTINIITIFDNRQNPQNLTKEIKKSS